MAEKTKKKHARFIRGADAGTLSKSVEKMKKVSRITNAIYLQQGLIDGSILPDDLLSEILKLGTAKSSALIGTESNKLKADVESLKTLAQSIKLTQEMKDNLDHFLGLEDIRNSVEGLGDVGSWSDDSTVTDITKKLKDNELSLPLIDKISGYVEVIGKAIDDLSLLQDLNTKGRIANAHGPFINIGEDGQHLIDETKTLTPDHSDFKSISDIQSLMSVLSVIFKGVDGIAAFSKHTKTMIGNKAAVGKNFENFKQVSSYSSGSQDLKTVSQLYNNRQNRKSSDLKFSFPFMDSGRNIIELSNDISDPWMKTVIKSDGFAESLSMMSSLGGSLKTINEALTLSKQETGLEMTTVLEAVDHLLTSTFDQSEAEKVSNSFTDCGTKLAKPVFQLDDMKVLQTDSMAFDKTAYDLKKVSSEMLKIIQDEEFRGMLNEIVAISNKWNNNDAIVRNQVFEEFKKYANLEKFTAEFKRLKELSGKIGLLKTGLKKSAGDVNKNIDKIGPFQTAYAPFADGFTCLVQIESPKPLIEMISLTQKVMTLTAMKQGFAQVEKYIEKVSKALPDIKKVKNELDAMKGKTTPATDALNILHDRESHSRIIGSATQGIVNMETALEKKTVFEGLSPEISLVKDQMKLVALDSKDRKNLDDLVSIEPLLVAMYQSLDSWESSLEDSNSAKLADHASIFLNAKSVSEVLLDFDESLKSLGKLINEVSDAGVKDKLKSVQKILEEMSLVGLKFSDFSKSFDDSKTSLTALDTFFADYGKAAPSSGGWPIKNLGTVKTTTIAALLSSAASSNALLISLCIGIPIGLLILLAIVVFLCIKRRREKKKFKKLIRPIEPVNPRGVKMDEEFQLDKTQPLEDPIEAAPVEQKPTKPLPSKDKVQPHQKNQSSFKKVVENTLKVFSLKSTQSLEVSGRSYEIDKSTLENVSGIIYNELRVERKRAENKRAEDLKEHKNTEDPNGDKFLVEHYFLDAVNTIISRAEVECNAQPDAECVKLHEYQGNTNMEMEGAFKIKYPNQFQMIVAKSPRNDEQKVSADELEKFWFMIKQENVKEIYMLSGLEENGASVCGKYFPEEPKTALRCGQFVIKCENKRMEMSDAVVCRTLQVNDGKTTFSVEHHQHEPKKQRAADNENKVALNPYTYSALLRKAHRSKGGPIVVHCQNGVDRSGVFAYTELLLQQVKKKNGYICFLKTLKDLRRQFPRKLEILPCAFSIITMLVFLYGDATSWLIELLITAYEVRTEVHRNDERYRRKQQERIDKSIKDAEDLHKERLALYKTRMQLPEKQRQRLEKEKQGWIFEKDGWRAIRTVKDVLGNDKLESFNDDWTVKEQLPE
ncbi:unnamed protein product [Caenorhabditis brenneri]